MTHRPFIVALQVLIVHLSSLTTHISWYLLHNIVAFVMKYLGWALLVVALALVLLVMAPTKILKESRSIEDALILIWLHRDKLIKAGHIVINGWPFGATGGASIRSTVWSVPIIAIFRLFSMLYIVVLLYDHMRMALQRQISIHRGIILALNLVNLLVIKLCHKFNTLFLKFVDLVFLLLDNLMHRHDPLNQIDFIRRNTFLLQLHSTESLV